MPGNDMLLLAISGFVFLGVALLVLAVTGLAAERGQVLRRFETLSAAPGAERREPEAFWSRLDPARLGLDAAAQRTLRVALIRAGFFDRSAVSAYAATRAALLVLLPALALAAGQAMMAADRLGHAALVAIALLVAIVLPKAFLSRAQRTLELRYRVSFPDFLDMLVVCIDAGLSLEAALDRAARELGPHDEAFRANLDLMMAEMRAGKSTSDALRALADRLGLREARGFAALLAQTLELGTDVAQALTTFSDEMRDKRMARAEEKAAALPPKLTLPLGLFIFPVVLIVVLAPAVVRLTHAMGH